MLLVAIHAARCLLCHLFVFKRAALFVVQSPRSTELGPIRSPDSFCPLSLSLSLSTFNPRRPFLYFLSPLQPLVSTGSPWLVVLLVLLLPLLLFSSLVVLLACLRLAASARYILAARFQLSANRICTICRLTLRCAARPSLCSNQYQCSAQCSPAARTNRRPRPAL